MDDVSTEPESVSLWRESIQRAPRAGALVLPTYAWHARKTGLAWPAVETVMEWTKLTETAVHRQIRKHEAAGDMVVVHPANTYRDPATGRVRKTVTYRVCPSAHARANANSTSAHARSGTSAHARQRPNPKEETEESPPSPPHDGRVSGLDQSSDSGSGLSREAKREQFDQALSAFPPETIAVVAGEAWLACLQGDGTERGGPQRNWSVPAIKARLRGWCRKRGLPEDEGSYRQAAARAKADVERASATTTPTTEPTTIPEGHCPDCLQPLKRVDHSGCPSQQRRVA